MVKVKVVKLLLVEATLVPGPTAFRTGDRLGDCSRVVSYEVGVKLLLLLKANNNVKRNFVNHFICAPETL